MWTYLEFPLGTFDVVPLPIMSHEHCQYLPISLDKLPKPSGHRYISRPPPPYGLAVSLCTNALMLGSKRQSQRRQCRLLINLGFKIASGLAPLLDGSLSGGLTRGGWEALREP